MPDDLYIFPSAVCLAARFRFHAVYWLLANSPYYSHTHAPAYGIPASGSVLDQRSIGNSFSLQAEPLFFRPATLAIVPLCVKPAINIAPS
jgi:hypothetical protein